MNTLNVHNECKEVTATLRMAFVMCVSSVPDLGAGQNRSALYCTKEKHKNDHTRKMSTTVTFVHRRGFAAPFPFRIHCTRHKVSSA